MKRYVVTLDLSERQRLSEITRKGSHSSQKVINALILLNCDEGSFNERRTTGDTIAGVLQISLRKVDGDFEAHLIALSCSEPPAGNAQWSLRLLAQRVVELNYIDSVSHETVRRVLKKTKSSHGNVSSGDTAAR